MVKENIAARLRDVIWDACKMERAYNAPDISIKQSQKRLVQRKNENVFFWLEKHTFVRQNVIKNAVLSVIEAFFNFKCNGLLISI